MGVMDEIYQTTGRAGGGDFLKGDDKRIMAETRQPFNVRAVKFRTNPRYTDEQTKQPRQEWVLDLRFLDTSGQVVEIDNGEGELAPLDRTLVMTNSEQRNAVMPKLKQMVDAAISGGQEDGIGPFFLYKQAVKGQGNPAYMLGDWAPNGAAPAAAAPPPPPSPDLISPDGKWRWDGAAWVPNQAPPSPPPPPPSAPPVSVVPVQPPTPVGQVPFSQGASSLPEPGKSQEMPKTITRVSGGDGEGGSLQTEYVKADEIRQVVYREDGVIQTPSGALLKAADVAERPAAGPSTGAILSPDGKFYLDNGAWKPLPPLPGERPEPEAQLAPTLVPADQAREEAAKIDADSRGIVPETAKPAQPVPIPPPPTEPPEGVATITGKQRKTIPMEGVCDTCGKKVKGSAFKNSKGRWILTHTCPAPDPERPGVPVGSKTVDVHDRVMAILQEATA